MVRRCMDQHKQQHHDLPEKIGWRGDAGTNAKVALSGLRQARDLGSPAAGRRCNDLNNKSDINITFHFQYFSIFT